LFTVTGVLELRQAGLSPPWVSALGWLSAAAHVLELFTLAQRGPFAADGIIAGLVPLTTVIWILALAAARPRSQRGSRHCHLRNRRVTKGTEGRAVTSLTTHPGLCRPLPVRAAAPQARPGPNESPCRREPAAHYARRSAPAQTLRRSP
jgi:hypothetical protein